jgi:tetratricopeptide (TPR) repeat protein
MKALGQVMTLLIAAGAASCATVDPEEELRQANARFDQQDWDGAIVAYTGILDREPTFARAWNNRGVCKLQKRDLVGAISDFDRCVQVAPDFAEGFYDRGTARLRRGDLEGAIADFGEAIRLNPKYGKALAGRGLARGKKGDLNASAVDLKEALDASAEDSPDRPAIQAELVRVLKLRDGK